MVSDGKKHHKNTFKNSLNPCCNGRWSLTRAATARHKPLRTRLNPCCNGRWSLTAHRGMDSGCAGLCLNPCCNGRWSLTDASSVQPKVYTVLILVVMEDGLWLEYIDGAFDMVEESLNPCCNGRWSLTVWTKFRSRLRNCRLNPCCNGRWSLTPEDYNLCSVIGCLNPCCNGRWSLTLIMQVAELLMRVLILVVMEDGLWRWKQLPTSSSAPLVLILVVMEDGLWQNYFLEKKDSQL